MQTLIHRIRHGDREAFAALCAALTDDVHQRVRIGVHDPRQAELVVATTFVEVWRLVWFHDQSHGDVRAWVYAIADARTVQWLRSPPTDTTDSAEATGALAWWVGFTSEYDSCQQREFHHLLPPADTRSPTTAPRLF